MAVTLYSESALFDAAMGYFRLSFPRQDLSDRSFFGLLARAFARFVVLTQQEILQVDNDSVPAYQQDADGNLRSRTSSEALDAWAFVFGLPSTTPGVYGRKGATISTGGSGVPSGVATTFVPAGTQGVDSTTQVVVQTADDVTLNGPPNTNSVRLVSLTTGTKANLPAGSVITWLSPPAGLAATMTLTAALVGGDDRESDNELLARLLRRIQTPPRGGTAADYRTWAEESVDITTGAQLGIQRAYVYPLRSGLGTVDILCLVAGSGANRVPGLATLLKVRDYIDTKRPVTAKSFLVYPDDVEIRIRVRITPSTAKGGLYGYDWYDSGLPTTITAHSAMAKTISCAAPAALRAAVDAGSKPRVQLINSGGTSPLPFQARVLSYVAGAPDVLTLDSFPPAGPVDGTDYFWAGGGAVDLVSSRIVTYVDGLGPGRGLFADPYDVWESDVTLARIADIVMETRDTDGTRMIADIPKLAMNGITIAVGAGAFAPNSFTPRDGGPLIEFATLRAGGIEIVQAT